MFRSLWVPVEGGQRRPADLAYLPRVGRGNRGFPVCLSVCVCVCGEGGGGEGEEGGVGGCPSVCLFLDEWLSVCLSGWLSVVSLCRCPSLCLCISLTLSVRMSVCRSPSLSPPPPPFSHLCPLPHLLSLGCNLCALTRHYAECCNKLYRSVCSYVARRNLA